MWEYIKSTSLYLFSNQHHLVCLFSVSVFQSGHWLYKLARNQYAVFRQSLVACDVHNHCVSLFSRLSLTGCGPAVFQLWAFFSLQINSRVFFFLGVACLDYNFGVSPGVANKKRLDQFLFPTNILTRLELKVLLARFSLVHVFASLKRRGSGCLSRR